MHLALRIWRGVCVVEGGRDRSDHVALRFHRSDRPAERQMAYPARTGRRGWAQSHGRGSDIPYCRQICSSLLTWALWRLNLPITHVQVATGCSHSTMQCTLLKFATEVHLHATRPGLKRLGHNLSDFAPGFGMQVEGAFVIKRLMHSAN